MRAVHQVRATGRRVFRRLRGVGAYLVLAVAVVVGINSVEDLARANCRSVNQSNETIRFILDSGLRLRSPTNPLSPQLRQLYVDVYRRVPDTDCSTGKKTYFDPPFPN